VFLAALLSACSLFAAKEEVKPIRPGSARDPTGSSAAVSGDPAPATTLNDLTWGWSRDDGGFEQDGESVRFVSYERDNAQAKDRRGLHRVMIAQATVKQQIPLFAVDATLVGFQEAFLGETAGIVDRRSMVWVKGPDVGRRSKWSSIEYTAADGVPTKVYSVVFIEDRSLAIVSTLATQGTARLQDTASLAQDVADRLTGRDNLELPSMRTFGA